MAKKIGKRARRMAIAIEQIHRMGGKRSRYILTVLLSGGYIKPGVFIRANRTADFPIPIEQDRTGQGFVPRKPEE
jgi:hypothetical protein